MLIVRASMNDAQSAPNRSIIRTFHMSGSIASDEIFAAILALGRVLLKVLLAQFVGYMMKSHKLIPETALAGIGAFAGLVSLPALLFKAVATLDFTRVDGTLVVALTAGKLILILISAHVGQITHSREGPGAAELAGGCFGLLTTNSDDLGLGLPVLGAIFPPDLVSMCFVLNALQSMLLNPLIFVLFGVGRARRDSPPDGEPPASNAEIVISVVRGLSKNFIILSVILGIAYNAAFSLGSMRGHPLPFFLDDLCTLLAGAFGPMVQFLAGAANVGSFGQLAQLDSALMPLLTVLLKSVLLPAFVMSLISMLGGRRVTMDFAFAFNCLPTAGSTLVFARPYAPGEQLNSLLASGLALGKLIGFPLLFIAAAVYKTKSVHDILVLDSAVAVAMQLLSALLLLPLLISILWAAAKWSKPPLRLIYVLACAAFGHVVSSLCAAHGIVQYAAAFPWISFFRWAADGTLIVMVIARQLEASHRLALTAPRPAQAEATSGDGRGEGRGGGGGKGGGEGVRLDPLLRGGNLRDLEAPLLDMHSISLQRLPSAHRLSSSVGTFALQLILAAATGLALTLPWTLFSGQPYPCADAIGCDAESDAAAAAGDFAAVPDGASPFLSRLVLPVSSPSTATHAHLPLWVPFGDVQELVYAVAYALMALLLLVSSSVVLRIYARTTAFIESQARGKELCLRLLKLRQRHSFYVRFECLAFVLGTRLALSSAICAQLAADEADVMLTGSMALMLLVNSLLANATGVLLFFLFGMGEGIFHVDQIRRALTDGRQLASGRRAKRSVVVQELLDASESVAEASGFVSPRTLKSVFKRAGAAATMQRYARKSSLAKRQAASKSK